MPSSQIINHDKIKTLHKKIEETIAVFSKQLPSSPAELYIPQIYMLGLGGKRIRPLLVLLANDLFNGNTEDALPAALAVELFHNFTLIHDDIMDNAPLRRNQPTVFTKWNPSVAILSGDAMFVKAYQTLEGSKNFHLIFPVFNKMALEVCEGQQLDLNYENSPTVSTSKYFKMIELKTAVLLAASLKIGAITANAAAEDIKNLYDFGINIGLAFQLQDDYLDIYGEEGKFGKKRGGDIIANKKTYLLIKTLELCEANPYKKGELMQWLQIQTKTENDSTQKIEAVKHIYDHAEIGKITLTEIENYHKKSIASLRKLNISETKKNLLIEFTSELLKREN